MKVLALLLGLILGKEYFSEGSGGFLWKPKSFSTITEDPTQITSYVASELACATKVSAISSIGDYYCYEPSGSICKHYKGSSVLIWNVTDYSEPFGICKGSGE